MRNFRSEPAVAPIASDVYVYHANPYGNRDGMRNLVQPDEFVNVGSVMEVKEQMLRCHESQKHWLDVSQGMDSYIQTMYSICADIAKMSGTKSWKYAEGFRRHLHLGMSAEERDMLKEVLGRKVKLSK